MLDAAGRPAADGHAPFRRAVLEALHRDVPRGETITYGELAAHAGNRKAARAAGTACARNPVPLVVPCHRVLPGTGGIGNYGGGPERKRALLDARRRPMTSLTRIDSIDHGRGGLARVRVGLDAADLLAPRPSRW